MTDLHEDLFADDAEAACVDGRWPLQYAELTDLLADALACACPGTAPTAARRLAGRLMARLTREFGGQCLYIPKRDALARVLRNDAIWGDWDGSVDGPRGVRALARREGVSTIHLYRILATHRAEHARAVQGDLFGVTPVSRSTRTAAACSPA